MLSIGTNTGAIMAQAATSSVTRDMETAMHRLSTGKRINSAADDAAGVAISSRLDSTVRGLNQSIRNALDAQALTDTAEGAMQEIETILQRIRELSIQAANDTNSADDRANLNAEAQSLLTEIDRISSSTTWAGQSLLDGTFTDKSFQVGTGTMAADQLVTSIAGVNANGLGLSAAGGEVQSVNISDGTNTLASGNIISLKLDDLGGFAIRGTSIRGETGSSISSAGDVNGDGIDDIILGGWREDSNGTSSGKSHVVFGKKDSKMVHLSENQSVSNQEGFVINGVDGSDYSGWSVNSAGDVNGDGLDDVIIGATGDDPNQRSAGASFVVFGKTDGAPIELSDIQQNTNNDGFVINGINTIGYSGYSVSSAGDLNNDGLSDVIIGAYNENSNGAGSGETFVVFGKTDGNAIELLDIQQNTNDGGFSIKGSNADDHSGNSVSSAGDVNGDGLNDLIVGAFTSSPNGLESGSAYVVFGKSDGNAVELSQIEQDSNDNGFVINGASAGDIAGKSVSGAGDVNGDGLDDVIMGAPMAEPNSYYGAGKSYVVYGKSDGASVELSSIEQDTNTSGFVINGISDRDFSGTSVSSAGDVNNDGLSDLIVGSYGRPNGGVSGTSYVIFGKNDGTKVDLSDIEDGSNTQGFAIDGSSRGDQAGISVSSAGDMNEDGLADVVLGASGSDINGNKTGAGYVIFGKTDNETINLSDLEKDPMLYANTSVVLEGKELSIDLGIFHDGVHADYFAAATAIAASINGDTKLSELGYSASAATIQQVADGIYAEGDVIVSRANSPVTAVAPSLLNKQDCESTINRIDSALQTLNSQRASLGAISNRLDHIVANNTNAATNVSKSLGRIQDADFAAESTSLAKNQILQQASTAMLAQANASKQNILELLQG